jgi:DNA polymerase I-like protein with 3'-5' exonuclease and polymerase domains
LGKAGNFGKLYGMGAEGFMTYAFNDFGVHLTMQQSLQFDESFFGTYKGLKPYHAQQKADAKRYKQVRSPLGRVRHLPLIDSPRQDIRAQAERQAINSPTQATLSDMMIWTFALCQQQLEDEYESGLILPFGVCHDAGYDYLKEEFAVELAKKQLDVMQNLPFHKVGWAPELQFTADAKMGLDLANMSKIKF